MDEKSNSPNEKSSKIGVVILIGIVFLIAIGVLLSFGSSMLPEPVDPNAVYEPYGTWTEDTGEMYVTLFIKTPPPTSIDTFEDYVAVMNSQNSHSTFTLSLDEGVITASEIGVTSVGLKGDIKMVRYTITVEQVDRNVYNIITTNSYILDYNGKSKQFNADLFPDTEIGTITLYSDTELIFEGSGNKFPMYKST